jgi:ABC-type multidrug transport system fused ATPase/permease subunit
MLQLNLVKANAEAGLTRIVQVLKEESTTPEPHTAIRAAVEPQMKRARESGLPCTEWKAVRFSYDGQRTVLKDITVSIPDGQSVALVGPSGSGKTTFASLLLRLHDVQEGSILLNGLDVRSYPLADLRSCYGVVPQDPFIFQGTILDNVKVTSPEASEEQVREALEMSWVNEFVRTLPNGLDTQVGEGGASLSGGQRQRVAIARAILARSQYFIFDEATSALDNESERRIQSAMETVMKGHTTFIIAHRLSTIRNVDRILVFNKGRVVQDGTYGALSSSDGLFRELLRSAEGDDADSHTI